jgi:hypothetical protein
MVGNVARNRTETAANTSRGMPDRRGCPVTAGELVCGYFIAAINARQALAGTLSVSPLRFLVSRTITASAALATSTHSPPFAPE